MKKLVAVIIILVVSLALTACSSNNYTNEERFAARANITLQQGMWLFSELEDADTYVFTSLEYFEANNAKVVRAACSVHFRTGDNFERFVFLISDSRDYLDNFVLSIDDFWGKPPVYIDETELFFINLYDFEFAVNADNRVNIGRTWDLTELYNNSDGDKSLIGMK
jgi:hypothetical protein